MSIIVLSKDDQLETSANVPLVEYASPLLEFSWLDLRSCSNA
jgi:hypothetical protein